MIYATYYQHGQLKKAQLDEIKYSKLKEDSTVVNLTIYSNELLMEQNYTAQKTGSAPTKKILND